ncbi:uncharacterized protein TNCV_911951 [Trichonephila clavipes]|nr:uncharacterized protein TNCV_911951 [Trichonephila clavipes]
MKTQQYSDPCQQEEWAAEHQDGMQSDWSQVLFMEKLRFSLECDTRHVLVWREKGSRNNLIFFLEKSHYRGDGLMVWAGISIGGHTDFYVIQKGNLMTQRYADEILRPHVVPYAAALLFGLAIHQNDHQARRRFVEWAQNEIAVVPDFHKRILFGDEAHFWLNGYVNKQNCRIWSEANPQVYVETPLHPEKLTVWCALWAGGIIGPYFFKNDEGHNVTVNDDRYRAMITNFFIPELNNHDVQELWFQQDGATCRTARATIHLLKDTFGDRLISRFGPVNWPPRSCDLTPLDYFLWGYVK